MPKIFFISKRQFIIVFVFFVILTAGILYMRQEHSKQVNSTIASERIVHMVTGEFKSKTADGKEIEAYRWDPGTIVVQQGEKAKLSIFGVSGDSHPFIIEGMNIKGIVKKGQETIVPLNTNTKGIYRIICTTHPDIAHGGPMIGYIVVQ